MINIPGWHFVTQRKPQNLKTSSTWSKSMFLALARPAAYLAVCLPPFSSLSFTDYNHLPSWSFSLIVHRSDNLIHFSLESIVLSPVWLVLPAFDDRIWLEIKSKLMPNLGASASGMTIRHRTKDASFGRLWPMGPHNRYMALSGLRWVCWCFTEIWLSN